MQLDLFNIQQQTDITEALFQAYYDCRRNKRNTINALKYEKNFESNLFALVEEIETGSYRPGRSIAFIVNKPVMREIFAADFRDRIVHHFLINKLNPLFESEFIYDSYSCRVGKGTHFGVKRVYDFINTCSKNYMVDCYILKLDMQGYFIHIKRNILFKRLKQFILKKYRQPDRELIISLCKIIIFNDPTKNCVIKGSKKDWEGLPRNKSLFHSPSGCGLPIGNFTSQVFANFYLNSFDHYVKKELGIGCYGRYVDDFVIVHQDKQYVKSIIPRISHFLANDLKLTLHPRKIYLQHYTKGVKFLGTIIKPNRIYIGNRTKGNFYTAIEKHNKIARDHKPTKAEQAAFLSSMNSYLGIMKHYKTYKLRKRMIFKLISGWWWNYVHLSGGIEKFTKRIKTIKLKRVRQTPG